MDFENLRRTWESFGAKDPLWSILSWEGKSGNNWDPQEFFNVGEQEVAYILGEAEKRMAIRHRSKCLDFGCGVGRLTFPLAGYFDQSHGVDISAAMIGLANQFKADKGNPDCVFHVNPNCDLRIFEDRSFDFVLSLIVLQHMEPAYFMVYIGEFLRILRNGGLLVFQLPDETENRAGYEHFGEDTQPVMEMYGKAQAEVMQFLEQHGGIVLDVMEDQSCGPDLRSYRYFVTKRA